jgi:hypothetical protein
MVRVGPATEAILYQSYTPTTVITRPGSFPRLEQHLRRALGSSLPIADETALERIATFCRSIGEACEAADPDNLHLDSMKFGGTEEEIIERTTDWCGDLARVGVTLCQMAGFPARLVYLVATKQAYSGHVLSEVFRGATWGALDPLHGIVYAEEGKPVTAWELVKKGEVPPHDAAAVSNYFSWEREKYDYLLSGLDSYNRSILEMSAKGWPGGLRWLHGEDRL